LLSYCNRFYNRQFITRKMATNDLLTNFENILDYHFSHNSDLSLPTVEKLATELNVSTSYLSDMLRSLTGQNTQQHIHNKLIEKAKEILTTTDLSVSEIAYELGFEYPQSFSKLFKIKTTLTPLEFRASFN
jgi:AraC family transcriptional regulator, transcriptional activator of pobA